MRHSTYQNIKSNLLRYKIIQQYVIDLIKVTPVAGNVTWKKKNVFQKSAFVEENTFSLTAFL